MKSRLTGVLCTCALAFSAMPVQASSIVTLNLDTVFSTGSVAPNGSSPYGTVVLDDGGGTGQVTMTLSLVGTIGAADLTQLYLNFDSSLDPGLLSFTFDAVNSTGPAAAGGGNNGIFTGTDMFQSDGDGAYDILFDFPPPPGNGKFNAGEVVVYDIFSSEAITAASFNFLSAEGGGAGTFLAASKFTSTGPAGQDSAWVGVNPIPVPAAIWLFGSGLLGLFGVARRKVRV